MIKEAEQVIGLIVSGGRHLWRASIIKMLLACYRPLELSFMLCSFHAVLAEIAVK